MTPLETAIFDAITRTCVQEQQPAAVLAAIEAAGYVVIERVAWDAVRCAPYSLCDECQQCSPECICPDRDVEDRWLYGDLDPSAEG